jgi:hypothetical protein
MAQMVRPAPIPALTVREVTGKPKAAAASRQELAVLFACADTVTLISVRLTAHTLTCAAEARVPKSRGMAVARSTADAVMSDLQLP